MKVIKLYDNALTPLGFDPESNLRSICEGKCGLGYHSMEEIPFRYVASIINDDELHSALYNDIKPADKLLELNPTKFEMVALYSAYLAVRNADIDPQSPRTLFILSTTKGNIEAIGGPFPGQDLFLAAAAGKIAGFFGNTNLPIVVSNACISGLCAQIEAMRCIESGQYDVCVVIGADVVTPFTLAGFNCLKALSDEFCRPFSACRKGLNLGEAAATIIYAAGPDDDTTSWKIDCGAIRNDANHISGPSRTGEGSYRALDYVLGHSRIGKEEIACVNVHGTATPYNDEMEAIALSRAGLADLPINTLKGFFGHTLGAAGILETVMTMHAIDNGIVLPTHGFDTLGVSESINIVSEVQKTDRQAFVKLLSGFGGCNAAAMFYK